MRTEDGRNTSPVHPLVLTLFTLFYIILTVSFPKYALSGVLLFFTYPIQIIWLIATMSLTILSLNFIGDGIGEAFQAKKR